MRRSISTLFTIVVATALFTFIYNSFAASSNGFNLNNAVIPADQVLSGGPPKDGIPALDNAQFIAAADAHYLHPADRILGIQINGISKAYPIAILNWHEIVNDSINNEHFSITYCPLCGTGVAFSSQVNESTLNFGVSGLLYNSDVLLYDRETESLWSQIKGQAISGKLAGAKLQRLPITHTSWSNWQETHPHTLVMSDKTGYERDYKRNPYAGYEKTRALYFEVTHQAPEYFHPKQRVLGLEINNQFKAYPLSEIDKAGKSMIEDYFGGQLFTIHWDKINQQASITDAHGKLVPAIEGYWFAWFTFHPQTEVYRYAQ